METSVQLVKDAQDRQIVGVNRLVWDSLIRRKNCRFATPRGGQRLFCTIFIKPSSLISSDLDLGQQDCLKSQKSGPVRTCSALGRFVTIAMLRDVASDGPMIWLSQEWIQDNGMVVEDVFPDFQDQWTLGSSPSSTCWIDTTGYIELDEVILECNDEATFASSQRDGSKHLLDALHNQLPILRQGSIAWVKLPGSNDSLDAYDRAQQRKPLEETPFKVLMCGPVMQGVVGPNTKIVVVQSSPSRPPSPNGTVTDLLQVDDNTSVISAETDVSDSGWLDNLLPRFHGGVSQVPGLHHPLPEDLRDAEAELPSKPLPVFPLVPHALTCPWPIGKLHPPPGHDEDEHARLYVDVGDLARMGCLSGDYVLLRRQAGENEIGRMCRVFGIDIKSKKSKDINVWMSPVLLHNVSHKVTLSPLPPGAGLPPPAVDATICRVASPAMNDKRVLDVALQGLTHYFESAKRIVCQGDLIPIVVDEERAKLTKKPGIMDLSKATVVYFKVTSLTPPTDTFAPATSLAVNGTSVNKKLVFGTSLLIDTKETHLLERGMEHERIPVGVTQYFTGQAPPSPPAHPNSPFSTLLSLVLSNLHPSAAVLGLSTIVLLHGAEGVGKRHTIRSVARHVGINYAEVNCFDLVGESEQKTEDALREVWQGWEDAVPVLVCLRNLDALSKMDKGEEVAGKQPHIAGVLQDLFKGLSKIQMTHDRHPLLVTATVNDSEKLSNAIRSCFKHEIPLSAPDEPERLAILHDLLQKVPLAPDVGLPALAMQTAALNARDLSDMCGRAAGEAMKRVLANIAKIPGKHDLATRMAQEQDLARAGVCLTAKDFELALDRARKDHADSIGAPKIPNVTWDDVGGLAHVKSEILDTIQLPLEHPELFASGMKKRSGVLLYGPPGTGKTLVAKAVATELNLNFLSVKGPELLNMYIGESEANVRKVFQRARDARPCVIFFDELDSVAPKRGDKGDSGGVMDRIVSQLLAELDGMSGGGDDGTSKGDVFVIGATNRPDLLDSALLRPGRFDKLLYLGVSTTHDQQLHIIEALTRKFRLASDLNLKNVAEKCPFNYTGADFYALCSDAMLKAMVRQIEQVDAKIAALNAQGKQGNHPFPLTPQYYLDHMATPEDTIVEVKEVDFDGALADLIPSVPMAELERYSQIRAKFEDESKKKKDTEK